MHDHALARFTSLAKAFLMILFSYQKMRYQGLIKLIRYFYGLTGSIFTHPRHHNSDVCYFGIVRHVWRNCEIDGTCGMMEVRGGSTRSRDSRHNVTSLMGQDQDG